MGLFNRKKFPKYRDYIDSNGFWIMLEKNEDIKGVLTKIVQDTRLTQKKDIKETLERISKFINYYEKNKNNNIIMPSNEKIKPEFDKKEGFIKPENQEFNYRLRKGTVVLHYNNENKEFSDKILLEIKK